jgi:hypothetical protein
VDKYAQISSLLSPSVKIKPLLTALKSIRHSVRIHKFSQRVPATTSCNQILLDPQGEVAHTPVPKKGILIIFLSFHFIYHYHSLRHKHGGEKKERDGPKKPWLFIPIFYL